MSYLPPGEIALQKFKVFANCVQSTDYNDPERRNREWIRCVNDGENQIEADDRWACLMHRSDRDLCAGATYKAKTLPDNAKYGDYNWRLN